MHGQALGDDTNGRNTSGSLLLFAFVLYLLFPIETIGFRTWFLGSLYFLRSCSLPLWEMSDLGTILSSQFPLRSLPLQDLRAMNFGWPMLTGAA